MGIAYCLSVLAGEIGGGSLAYVFSSDPKNMLLENRLSAVPFLTALR